MLIIYVACILMPLTLFLQVIFRYVFKNPILGIEEIATMSFIWMVIFGCAVLFKEKQYIIVDALVQKFSVKIRNIISIINNIIMAAIISILIHSCYLAIPYQKFYKTVALGIPKVIHTFAFIISLIFMLSCTIESIILLIKQELNYEK